MNTKIICGLLSVILLLSAAVAFSQPGEKEFWQDFRKEQEPVSNDWTPVFLVLVAAVLYIAYKGHQMEEERRMQEWRRKHGKDNP